MRRFRWTLHNLIGHPASEVAYLLGLKRLSAWIHDATLPSNAIANHDAEQGSE